MDKELYRLFSFVSVKVENPDGQSFEITMNDGNALDFINCLLETKKQMTITIVAKDGEDAR